MVHRLSLLHIDYISFRKRRRDWIIAGRVTRGAYDIYQQRQGDDQLNELNISYCDPTRPPQKCRSANFIPRRSGQCRPPPARGWGFA
jgi:hypothetical protein